MMFVSLVLSSRSGFPDQDCRLELPGGCGSAVGYATGASFYGSRHGGNRQNPEQIATSRQGA